LLRGYLSIPPLRHTMVGPPTCPEPVYPERSHVRRGVVEGPKDLATPTKGTRQGFRFWPVEWTQHSGAELV